MEFSPSHFHERLLHDQSRAHDQNHHLHLFLSAQEKYHWNRPWKIVRHALLGRPNPGLFLRNPFLYLHQNLYPGLRPTLSPRLLDPSRAAVDLLSN